MEDRNISYGVLATVDRIDSLLPQTIANLSDAGFHNPVIYLDDAQDYHDYRIQSMNGTLLRVVTRHPRIGALGNWLLSLLEMYIRSPKSSHYLLFQDDLLCVKGLWGYLHKCRLPQNSDYLNLYTVPSNQDRAPKSDDGQPVIGWYPSNGEGKGAVALMLGKSFVENLIIAKQARRRLATNPPNSLRGIDNVTIVTSRQCNITEYVHYPSLVQHVGAQSVVKNQWKLPSNCFFEHLNAEELLIC